MEVLVSDGIAGMTLPVPLARVSTSEILMPLLLRTWQTWLVIHLKMFFLQEEVSVAPSPHASKRAGCHFGNKTAALGRIREYMEILLQNNGVYTGHCPKASEARSVWLY